MVRWRGGRQGILVNADLRTAITTVDQAAAACRCFERGAAVRTLEDLGERRRRHEDFQAIRVDAKYPRKIGPARRASCDKASIARRGPLLVQQLTWSNSAHADAMWQTSAVSSPRCNFDRCPRAVLQTVTLGAGNGTIRSSMNDGLGFVFFVLTPLFGFPQVGALVGLLLVLARHALARSNPPDYLLFFATGASTSAAFAECGFLLVLRNGRDMSACLHYAWIAGVISAATWIPCAVLAWFPRQRRVRLALLIVAQLVCWVVAILIALRLHYNMNGGNDG